MENERWAPVPCFEGRYEVSDTGLVRSLVTRRILAPAATSRGYLSVHLYTGESPKRGISRTVHSLVAEAFIGPRLPGMQVNHLDTNKRNNNVANLEYATSRQNIAHAIASGRDSWCGRRVGPMKKLSMPMPVPRVRKEAKPRLSRHQSQWATFAPRGASRFKGVSIHRQCGRWQAEIRAMGKSHYLGLFESELDAARAYDAAARELHGEFARVNGV